MTRFSPAASPPWLRVRATGLASQAGFLPSRNPFDLSPPRGKLEGGAAALRPRHRGRPETRMDDRQRQAVILTGATAAALLGMRALARRRRAFSFQDRTVLITGGSRGLGLVLGRELAALGARLVICARDAEELERAREDLAGRGGGRGRPGDAPAGRGAGVRPARCVGARREQVDELMDRARARFDRIDVLVNNAGLIQVGPLEVQTLADFEEAMRIHFWGPL